MSLKSQTYLDKMSKILIEEKKRGLTWSNAFPKMGNDPVVNEEKAKEFCGFWDSIVWETIEVEPE